MSAVISSCGRYRYELRRRLIAETEDERSVCFIMVNPSTADSTTDDPTIRRCMGFALEWHYAELVVVNLFAYRATDPKDLKAAALKGVDVVGPENDSYLRSAVLESDLTICAWGKQGQLYGREQQVAHMLRSLDAPPELYALRLTKDGTPCHPLYLPKNLQPWPWQKGTL